MSVITVQVPTAQWEYDVAFERCAEPGRSRFHVFQVWDENGRNVMGEERAMVVKHALGCYHAEMLAAVRGV